MITNLQIELEDGQENLTELEQFIKNTFKSPGLFTIDLEAWIEGPYGYFEWRFFEDDNFDYDFDILKVTAETEAATIIIDNTAHISEKRAEMIKNLKELISEADTQDELIRESLIEDTFVQNS